jgi:hypothetical protein
MAMETGAASGPRGAYLQALPALVAAWPARPSFATIVQLHANTLPALPAEPAGPFAFGIEVNHDPGYST